jgi:N-acetylmuramoyl-L-alanine amidase
MQSRLKGLLAATGIAAVLATAPSMTHHAAASDTVVVRPGDTLSGIALTNGVALDVLTALNGIDDPNRIYVGQTLRLKPAPANDTPVAAASAAKQHRVSFGETLTGIAQRYGTTVAAIAAANQLPSVNRILAGELLLIPSRAAARQPSPPAAPPAAAPAVAVKPMTHRVAFGETLTGIARRYGTTIAAIVAANGLANPSFVLTGTILRIPGSPVVASCNRTGVMPASMARLVAARATVGHAITEEANRFGVAPSLALALAWQESGWQQNVVSSAGAIGVMQLLPATGDWVGPGLLGHAVNLRDMQHNVRSGVRLLRHYLDRYHGDRAQALAAYYQGQTAVDRHGIYPVSRPYIASILALEAFFR